MTSPLDYWTPPSVEQPDYYDTVRYIYKHLAFHISEDEAYTILDSFIEKWNGQVGQVVMDETFKDYVVQHMLDSNNLFLPPAKIRSVVDLILGYLREVGQFKNADESVGAKPSN